MENFHFLQREGELKDLTNTELPTSPSIYRVWSDGLMRFDISESGDGAYVVDERDAHLLCAEQVN
jgi:hypothetical protein